MTGGGGRPGDPSPRAFPLEPPRPDRRRWITALALAIVLVGTAGALAATSGPRGEGAADSAQLAIRPRSNPPTASTDPVGTTVVPATSLPTATTHLHPAPARAATGEASDAQGEGATEATLAAPGTSTSTTSTTLPADNCTAEDLAIGLELTKPSYALGELITGTGSITNTSEQTCGPIRGHEAWFMDPARGSPLVLPLSVGYPCAAEADCSTPPGASREFPVCWTQVVMFGEPIDAGTYQVTIYGYLPGMVESFDLVISDTAPPPTTVPFECNPFRDGAAPSQSWKPVAAG